MRSLGTIRTRVERLASVCLPSPAPLDHLPRAVSIRAVPGLRRGSAAPTRRRWRRPARIATCGA